MARTDALGELYGDLIDSLTDVFVQVGDARQAFRADPSGVVSEDEDRRSKVVLFKLALRNWIEGDYEGCSLKLALTGIEAIATVQDYLIEEHGRGQFEPVETLGYCVVGALRKLKELDTS